MSLSPLRYPGGKSKLTAYVLETMKLNGLEGAAYAEPFAGGCAIAWYLLLNGHARKVYINDLDPAIHSFWYCVLYKTEEFCELIRTTSVTMDEWYKQRDIYRESPNDYLKLGFATFFLNRTNRSGIIKAGVIGGLEQKGDYKLDCRFNKERLIEQIMDIAARRDDIRLSNLDAAHFIEEHIPDIEGQALINIDPPYYVKGKGLYQNFFEHDDHYRLFESIKRNVLCAQYVYFLVFDTSSLSIFVTGTEPVVGPADSGGPFVCRTFGIVDRLESEAGGEQEGGDQKEDGDQTEPIGTRE